MQYVYYLFDKHVQMRESVWSEQFTVLDRHQAGLAWARQDTMEDVHTRCKLATNLVMAHLGSRQESRTQNRSVSIIVQGRADPILPYEEIDSSPGRKNTDNTQSPLARHRSLRWEEEPSALYTVVPACLSTDGVRCNDYYYNFVFHPFSAQDPRKWLSDLLNSRPINYVRRSRCPIRRDITCAACQVNAWRPCCIGCFQRLLTELETGHQADGSQLQFARSGQRVDLSHFPSQLRIVTGVINAWKGCQSGVQLSVECPASDTDTSTETRTQADWWPSEQAE
ncbi:hypothetical protein VTO42DRAFT_3703 [Malbranchea cinnamomea]